MVTQLLMILLMMTGTHVDEPRRCLRHTECRTSWLPKVIAKSAKKLEIFAPQSTQRESRAPRSR